MHGSLGAVGSRLEGATFAVCHGACWLFSRGARPSTRRPKHPTPHRFPPLSSLTVALFCDGAVRASALLHPRLVRVRAHRRDGRLDGARRGRALLALVGREVGACERACVRARAWCVRSCVGGVLGCVVVACVLVWHRREGRGRLIGGHDRRPSEATASATPARSHPRRSTRVARSRPPARPPPPGAPSSWRSRARARRRRQPPAQQQQGQQQPTREVFGGPTGVCLR
mgnify:CR=1 FL=1